ncbi:hypothetical protein [Sphingomonas sp. Leaf21]|uniref:hypothetical protein n=1 Tax=Sphingomonas sp. Leaf21 TaxID=2876550 RepID=UPI001E311368|nr:hypothetical protein [Sphingomonas sp. Leaf21]
MDDPHHPDPEVPPTLDEHAYLLRRAEAHLQLADKAVEGGARAIHQRLSRMYGEQARLLALVPKD